MQVDGLDATSVSVLRNGIGSAPVWTAPIIDVHRRLPMQAAYGTLAIVNLVALLVVPLTAGTTRVVHLTSGEHVAIAPLVLIPLTLGTLTPFVPLVYPALVDRWACREFDPVRTIEFIISAPLLAAASVIANDALGSAEVFLVCIVALQVALHLFLYEWWARLRRRDEDVHLITRTAPLGFGVLALSSLIYAMATLPGNGRLRLARGFFCVLSLVLTGLELVVAGLDQVDLYPVANLCAYASSSLARIAIAVLVLNG